MISSLYSDGTRNVHTRVRGMKSERIPVGCAFKLDDVLAYYGIIII